MRQFTCCFPALRTLTRRLFPLLLPAASAVSVRCFIRVSIRFLLRLSQISADFPGTGILCILYAIIIAIGKTDDLMTVIGKADVFMIAAGKADDLLLQQEIGRFR